MHLSESAINDYILEKKIKNDSFGSTYLAKMADSNRACIIKHFNLKKSELVNRIPFIEREAGVLKNIKHANVPHLIDFIIKENENGVDVYLIQEYIKGENLYQHVKVGKVFSEPEVIKIAVDICKILDYLHAFSPPIIHQDIKPANILQTSNNAIYLIDFGSVKQAVLYNRSDEMGLSTILGTQGYMPLEQFEGRAVPGSDIYALGLTLIFLLSNKEPLEMEKDGLIVDFSQYINVSAEFKTVLQKMLQPDYKLRYRTVSELESDLFEIIEEKRRKSKKGKKSFEMVRSELSEAEKLRWYGLPVKNPLIEILSGFVFLINLLFFISPFHFINQIGRKSSNILIKQFNNQPNLDWVKFALFTFISSFLILLYFSIRDITGKNKIYGLTDKRIFIINNSWIKKVSSYSLETLKDIEIHSQNREKNTGDLYISFENRLHNFIIPNMENAHLIFKIIKGLLEK